MKGASIAKPYTVRYKISEDGKDVVPSHAARPIVDVVHVAAADNRIDAAAQALTSLADAGLPLGRDEEIRIRVEDH